MPSRGAIATTIAKSSLILLAALGVRHIHRQPPHGFKTVGDLYGYKTRVRGYNPPPISDSTLVTWNGTHVAVSEAFLRKRYRDEALTFHRDALEAVLNIEPVALCPFCGLPDHVSAIDQGAEHEKLECHEGRADHYFAQHTWFSPASFAAAPTAVRKWELRRVMEGYKYQGNGPRVLRHSDVGGGLYSMRVFNAQLRSDLSLTHHPMKWENVYLHV
jgi:hypothetical protein